MCSFSILEIFRVVDTNFHQVEIVCNCRLVVVVFFIISIGVIVMSRLRSSLILLVTLFKVGIAVSQL